MNKELIEYYKSKISKLSDNELLEILSIGSKDIIQIAKNEANLRDLNIENININFSSKSEIDLEKIDSVELKRLNKWNWGAFLLNGVWALGNRLTLWAILSFIPGLNIIVVFYLGNKGNQLAWEKTDLRSIDDFLKVQDYWSKWGIRLFWITFIIGFISFIFIG